MFPDSTQLADGAGARYRVVIDLVAERELVLEPVTGGPRRTISYRDVLEGRYVPDTDSDLLEG